MADIQFEYQFKFEDGGQKNFVAVLSEDSLLHQDGAIETLPEWTLLDFHQCPHCPYDSAVVKHCPVARGISTVAETFKEHKSFAKVTVFVKAIERFYGKSTDLQTGLQSLFGLIMASADCSHMSFFRPMARYHLPFSTYEETVVRALGNFLIIQYLNMKQGRPTDWAAQSLIETYDKINILNKHIVARIRDHSQGDADRNAIVILDNFASLLSMELSAELEALDSLYKTQM